MEGLKEKISQAITDSGIAPPEAGLSKLTGPIDKQQLLIESKCFSEVPLDNRKCSTTIAKILYLLGQGQTFTAEEQTDIFFGATKLFQSSSFHVRRLLHVLLRTLNISETECFVITSSLVRDMSSHNDIFRSNAIRTTARVVDAQMISSIERYMKTALVDKNPFVTSSALVAASQLYAKSHADSVKRWSPEISECLNSRNPFVQFHALVLSYQLRKNDRVALHKVIQNMTSQQMKSPFADCMLIRFAKQLTVAERGSPLEQSLLNFLDFSLHHRSAAVVFDAAKAFVELAAIDHVARCKRAGLKQSEIMHPGAATNTLLPPMSASAKRVVEHLGSAVIALQTLLSSPKVVVRYSAIACLNQLAQFRADLVAPCTNDIEPLFVDANSLVAVTALTTVLKTGGDKNTEKLIKQVGSLLSAVSDSHRLDIVDAVTQLAITNVSRVGLVVGFLGAQLRDDGGQAFKSHLVSSMLQVTRAHDTVREETLLTLSEFIEDCEYPGVSCRVLAAIAEEAPKCKEPRRFVRYVYNRAVIDGAAVRAAAVSTLIEMAVHEDELQRDVYILLQTLASDIDDEVRDRAKFGLKVLANSAGELGDDDKSTVASETVDPFSGDEVEVVEAMLTEPLAFSLDALLDSLTQHYAAEGPGPTAVLNLADLPKPEEYHRQQQDLVTQADVELDHEFPTDGWGALVAGPSIAELLAAELPDLASMLGELHHSCEPEFVSEKESEYVVQVTKHYWKNSESRVALEFSIRNTLDAASLENVSLSLRAVNGSSAVQKLGENKVVAIGPNEVKTLIQVYDIKTPVHAGPAVFEAAMSFKFHDAAEPVGYEDTYNLEAVIVRPAETVAPVSTTEQQAKEMWEEIGAEHENVSKVVLGKTQEGLVEAANALRLRLHMGQCSDTPAPSATKHQFSLVGRLLENGTDHPAVVKVQMVAAPQGVLAKISSRCNAHKFNPLIASVLE